MPALSDSDLDRYDSSFINDASELSTYSTPVQKKDKIKGKPKPVKRMFAIDSDSEDDGKPVPEKREKLKVKKEEVAEVITLE